MYIPIIPAVRRLRQEYHEFEATLGCIAARPCLKTLETKFLKGYAQNWLNISFAIFYWLNQSLSLLTKYPRGWRHRPHFFVE
jgi:hypothetical protein